MNTNTSPHVQCFHTGPDHTCPSCGLLLLPPNCSPCSQLRPPTDHSPPSSQRMVFHKLKVRSCFSSASDFPVASTPIYNKIQTLSHSLRGPHNPALLPSDLMSLTLSLPHSRPDPLASLTSKPCSTWSQLGIALLLAQDHFSLVISPRDMASGSTLPWWSISHKNTHSTSRHTMVCVHVCTCACERETDR